MRGARADAEAGMTRVTISKIHQVLASRWEEYLTAPLPLKIPDRAFQRDSSGNQAVSSREMTRLRILALREFIRLDLPERAGDIFGPYGLPPVVIGLNEANSVAQQAYQMASNPTSWNRPEFPPPSITYTIRDRVSSVSGWASENDNAELLFLIVQNTFLDGAGAMDLFKKTEIGDTDGDGLNEFIDAWGNPIRFIRWPAGYRDGNIFQVGADFDMNGQVNLDALDPLLGDWGHDPLFANSDLKPGAGLFPLVISAGPDGLFGTRFDINGLPPDALEQTHAHPTLYWSSSPLPAAYYQFPNSYYYPDPYYPRGAGNVQLRQGALDLPNDPSANAHATDNVTNLDDFGVST